MPPDPTQNPKKNIPTVTLPQHRLLRIIHIEYFRAYSTDSCPYIYTPNNPYKTHNTHAQKHPYTNPREKKNRIGRGRRKIITENKVHLSCSLSTVWSDLTRPTSARPYSHKKNETINPDSENDKNGKKWKIKKSAIHRIKKWKKNHKINE